MEEISLLKIQLEDCALFIGEGQKARLQALFAKHELYTCYINKKIAVYENYSQAVMNLWCLLLEDKEHIVFDEGKLFYLPLTKYMLSQVKQQKDFQRLRSQNPLTDEQRFIIAIILANELSEWLMDVLQQQRFQYIYERMVTVHSKIQEESDKELQPLLIEVGKFIKLFFQQPEYRIRFNQLLRNTIAQAMKRITEVRVQQNS